MPLKFKRPLDSPASRIAAGLGRIAMASKSRSRKNAADAGVTPVQGEVLMHLLDSPEGLRLGDLAQKLGISAPSASETVATLVKKGLVRKTEGVDRRSVTIVLARKGSDLAKRTTEWPDYLADVISKLEIAEQQGVLIVLTKIIKQMQEQGHISPQRMCVTCTHFRPYAHADSAQPHHCAFVDAAFGASDLKLNCADHDTATANDRDIAWQVFNR